MTSPASVGSLKSTFKVSCSSRPFRKGKVELLLWQKAKRRKVSTKQKRPCLNQIIWYFHAGIFRNVNLFMQFTDPYPQYSVNRHELRLPDWIEKKMWREREFSAKSMGIQAYFILSPLPDVNNYIGADNSSQISSTSFRFASFDRLDLTAIIRHLSARSSLCSSPASFHSPLAIIIARLRLAFFSRFARR